MKPSEMPNAIMFFVRRRIYPITPARRQPQYKIDQVYAHRHNPVVVAGEPVCQGCPLMMEAIKV